MPHDRHSTRGNVEQRDVDAGAAAEIDGGLVQG
jgi:hypothetical protein